VDIHKTLARNVRRLREARGLTQAELATKTGMSVDEIRAIEAADYPSSIDTLDGLAPVLKVRSCELIQNPRRKDGP
jgi:transcriptional regulator with XRE-family HTH domain